jgi:hypothetical protein
MSNAASLITSEMKEDLQIYKSNNIRSYKKWQIFKPPNNRRLDWRSLNSDSSLYQSGFAAGQGSNQSFFHNGGEDIGPTLSPKGAPGHTPIAMHNEIPKEAEDVVPQGNTRLVSEGPPQVLFSKGRQIGKEDLYQALVDDWWCLLGTIRFYAKLHRLQQSYGLLQKKEVLSRICSPLQQSKKDLLSKNDQHVKKRSNNGNSLRRSFMDQPYPPGSESERRHASSDGYDESESVHEMNQIQDGRSFNFI